MSATTRTRPTLAVTVCAVLIAVIGLLVAYSRSRDERPRAEVGQLIDAADPLADAGNRVVLLPTTRLDIRWTGPREDVDDDAEVRQRQAPDDGSFVGLQVVSTPPSGAEADLVPADDVAEGSKVVIALALVADGRRYPLRSSENGSTSLPLRTYVAVAGTPDSLRLEVSYESRKQSVELRSGARVAGVFAPLYANRERTVSCGAPTLTTGVIATGPAATCAVPRIVRSPHLPRLQWAPAGKVWLVVRVETTVTASYRYRAPDGRTAGYESDRTRALSYRLDGVEPVLLPVQRSDRSDAPSREDVVFAVPASRAADGVLTVVSSEKPRLRYDSMGTSAPTLDSVDTTWRVRL